MLKNELVRVSGLHIGFRSFQVNVREITTYRDIPGRHPYTKPEIAPYKVEIIFSVSAYDLNHYASMFNDSIDIHSDSVIWAVNDATKVKHYDHASFKFCPKEFGISDINLQGVDIELLIPPALGGGSIEFVAKARSAQFITQYGSFKQ